LKLVFLPGMDGTGKLFSSFLPFLDGFECTVLPLPQTGKQDYETLAKHIKKELPNEDFILIAESFSGPIAVLLSQESLNNLRGVIFVATFLSQPKIALLHISKTVPIKAFMAAPFRKFFYKWLCFGFDAKDSTLNVFEESVRSVPVNILKARLKAISDMDLELNKVFCPALYLQAQNDQLVPQSKAEEFNKYFEDIEIETISGPHFLLQTKPEKCADVIKAFIG